MADNSLNVEEISKICIRCSKSVGTGLRCVRCGTLSHKSCLKYIKAQLIDDYTCICCPDVTLGAVGNSQMQTNITTDDKAQDGRDINIENKILMERMIYLEKIIKEKNDTIKFQNISIESLQEQISLMKRVNEIFNTKAPLETSVISQQTAEISGPTKKSEETYSRDLPPQATVNLIKPQEIRAAIHNAQASRICEDIVNSDNNMTSSQTSRRNVKPRNILVGDGGNRQKPKNLLIGTMCNENANLQAAKLEVLNHYHSTNWNPDTTVDEVKKHFINIEPHIEVKQLNSRFPQKYASFKISIPATSVDKAIIELMSSAFINVK
ncbi:unnamed protein product [Psylliodes chrysocephalus]|uniref:Uncharacterized protein n=1 Tax=Psylliodes chrysocephalus TaxID=3402493 RepID=A0A9P0CYN7_9CUCU|nr:unnamed protein product [Psylliodes chrysocephala]